ncbi:hypothetical protein ES703_42135 [subsurface metagenome]
MGICGVFVDYSLPGLPVIGWLCSLFSVLAFVLCSLCPAPATVLCSLCYSKPVFLTLSCSFSLFVSLLFIIQYRIYLFSVVRVPAISARYRRVLQLLSCSRPGELPRWSRTHEDGRGCSGGWFGTHQGAFVQWRRGIGTLSVLWRQRGQSITPVSLPGEGGCRARCCKLDRC